MSYKNSQLRSYMVIMLQCYEIFPALLICTIALLNLKDILDSNTLLDEDDLQKPDPASLKSMCFCML